MSSSSLEKWGSCVKLGVCCVCVWLKETKWSAVGGNGTAKQAPGRCGLVDIGGTTYHPHQSHSLPLRHPLEGGAGRSTACRLSRAHLPRWCICVCVCMCAGAGVSPVTWITTITTRQQTIDNAHLLQTDLNIYYCITLPNDSPPPTIATCTLGWPLELGSGLPGADAS